MAEIRLEHSCARAAAALIVMTTLAPDCSAITAILDLWSDIWVPFATAEAAAGPRASANRRHCELLHFKIGGLVHGLHGAVLDAVARPRP